MQIATLQTLREQRLPDETINETWARLKQQGTFDSPVSQNENSYNEDIVIARYKILQPSCQIEGVTPGCFLNTVTQEEVEKLENVVFLSRQYSRSLFANGDFSGRKTCWSWNGYTPAIEQIRLKTGKEPRDLVCANRDENGKLMFVCPFAQWRDEFDQPDPAGTKPPTCKTSISFLGLDLVKQMPFWIVFHGSSLPIVKSHLRVIDYKCVEARRQNRELNMYHFKTTISLKQQTTSKGRFYVVHFDDKQEITNSTQIASIKQAHDYFTGKFSDNPGQNLP